MSHAQRVKLKYGVKEKFDKKNKHRALNKGRAWIIESKPMTYIFQKSQIWFFKVLFLASAELSLTIKSNHQGSNRHCTALHSNHFWSCCFDCEPALHSYTCSPPQWPNQLILVSFHYSDSPRASRGALQIHTVERQWKCSENTVLLDKYSGLSQAMLHCIFYQ